MACQGLCQFINGCIKECLFRKRYNSNHLSQIFWLCKMFKFSNLQFFKSTHSMIICIILSQSNFTYSRFWSGFSSILVRNTIKMHPADSKASFWSKLTKNGHCAAHTSCKIKRSLYSSLCAEDMTNHTPRQLGTSVLKTTVLNLVFQA